VGEREREGRRGSGERGSSRKSGKRECGREKRSVCVCVTESVYE
jgi:hypothetical protein